MTYWQELTHAFGTGWNRFWFTPRDPRAACLLRILVGVVALYYVLSFTTDLVRWFGPNGLLPSDVVARLTTDPQAVNSSVIDRWSYFDLATQPNELLGLHIAGIVVLSLFTLGVFSRVTSVLSALVVLSYVHRAPMITGQFEPVLTMLLIYLCLAPTGACLSLDAWWRGRSASNDNGKIGKSANAAVPSIMANVAIRLIQVHLAAFYLVIGLTMLGGTLGAEYDPTWWRGEGMWWLIAKSESRLVDLTFLHGTTPTYLVNLWTHAVVALNLACGILIWNRLARPLLLVLAFLSWMALAVVTGLLSYCLIMVVAGLAFVSPERIARWTGAQAVAS